MNFQLLTSRTSIVLAAACLVWVVLISMVIGFVFGGWVFAGWFSAGLLLAVVVGIFYVLSDAYRNAIEIPATSTQGFVDPQIREASSPFSRFQTARSREEFRLGGMRGSGFRRRATASPRKMRSRRPGSR